MRDGAMDLSEDALAELDLVIGSVHSYFNLEGNEMTDRLMKAFESPSIRVLGHGTGRMLLQRESYPFDFDVIAERAAQRSIALEINASPERLDLPGHLVRAAKRKGCKFTISTDSHRPSHLTNMRFGILTARRGWLTRGDVLKYSASRRICGGRCSTEPIGRENLIRVAFARSSKLAVSPDGSHVIYEQAENSGLEYCSDG